MSNEQRFRGIPVSGGVAVARACLLNEYRHSDAEPRAIAREEIPREQQRLHTALDRVAQRLGQVKEQVAARLGTAEAEIFVAQKLIVEDVSLRTAMDEIIAREACNAEAAAASALDAFERRLRAVEDEYLSARASDITEIKRCVLDALGSMNPLLRCEGQDSCEHGRNRVVVALELTPAMTLELDAEQARAFVTERGGRTSHAAILARALGIPAVTGIPRVHEQIPCGTTVLVNGDTGEVVTSPSANTLARHPVTSRARTVTAGDEPVESFAVMANINLSSDAGAALEVKAEGIGLYRTEFECIAAGRLLTEDEQYERYAAVLAHMKGRPVYFRLLDVGGDKRAPFLDLPPEENPYLGCRGARFLLARPDVLAPQARALVRASRHGVVNVIHPMIVDLDQFIALKNLFAESVSGLQGGTVRHGIMFEVPSACLQAAALLEEADFATIGSNDLIQYLFVVDRDNEAVARDYTPDRPVFWDVLRALADAARAAGKPLSLCGEIGGDPRYISRLMDLGITSVSASVRLVARVRTAARNYRAGNNYTI